MKYVPKTISRAVGQTLVKTQKNSPTLLFAGGVVGVVTATVLACRATLRIEDVLVSHEKEMLEIGRLEHNQSVELSRDRQQVTLKTTAKVLKLYAVPTVVGIVSIGCLTKSHLILKDRNTQLTAAYVGLQKFLEGYRGRVREKIGKDEERNVYYASTPVELAQDTPNGPVKTFGTAPGQRSPYSQLFDDKNGNWQESHEYNTHFLRIKELNLTDKLRAQGSLMLNEVYDTLDMPRTPTGAICGWVLGHPDSDDFVEFEIIPLHDYHGTLMVDFNVAGVVYDMLSGHASGRSS